MLSDDVIQVAVIAWFVLMTLFASYKLVDLMLRGYVWILERRLTRKRAALEHVRNIQSVANHNLDRIIEKRSAGE